MYGLTQQLFQLHMRILFDLSEKGHFYGTYILIQNQN